jgi:hypothetical protein
LALVNLCGGKFCLEFPINPEYAGEINSRSSR